MREQTLRAAALVAAIMVAIFALLLALRDVANGDAPKWAILGLFFVLSMAIQTRRSRHRRAGTAETPAYYRQALWTSGGPLLGLLHFFVVFIILERAFGMSRDVAVAAGVAIS